MYSDDYLVGLYAKYGSQIEATKHVDVSRETIARAVRRAGIPLTGRKDNGKYQPQRKITSDELAAKAKYFNCSEIAKRHNMSEERVYRRARRLGIKVDTKNIGGHWRRRANRYGTVSEFDDSITLSAVREKYNDICQICGRPVDGNAIKNGHITKMYPTVDHIVPLSKGGTHTWNNVQLAHMACNSGKCDKTRGV